MSVSHLALVALSAFLILAVTSGAEVNSKHETQKMKLEGVSDDVVGDFAKEYDYYLTTGIKTEKFLQLVEAMTFNEQARNEAFQPRFELDPVLQSGIVCLGCRSGVSFLLNKRRHENATDEYVKKLARDICTLFNIMPGNVCNGLVDLNVDTLLYVIDNQKDLDAETICGILIGDPACPTGNPLHDWKIEVDNNRPKAEKPPAVNESSLTFVQISDLHFDPNYKQGAPAVCGEPACCRVKQGLASKPEIAAGKWGDYRDCDTPWEAIVDSYEQVKRQHKKIDLIYFTGDIIDHGIWETTIEGNKESIRRTMRKMKETFGDVQILPILGNHEPHPLNVYSPDYVPQSLSTQWLYDFVAEEWGGWIPTDAKASLKKAGYYTVLVKPGFRVIALNNNVAYVYNWWLLYNPEFVKGQLQWLHDTLLQAEKDKEKVHILGHIPPGDPTNFVTWDREFRRIVERFSDVITGQFNGHSHNDEFVIFYQKDKPKAPVNVAFNGGSITAYSYGNPNYKVYEVQPTTFKILNHESWIYNLTAANLAGDKKPEWFKMYSFKEDFGLSDLNPVELDKLVQKFSKDDKLAHKYFEYKYKLGDLMLAKGCDKTCLKQHICAIVTSVPGDLEQCNKYAKK